MSKANSRFNNSKYGEIRKEAAKSSAVNEKLQEQWDKAVKETEETLETLRSIRDDDSTPANARVQAANAILKWAVDVPPPPDLEIANDEIEGIDLISDEKLHELFLKEINRNVESEEK